jgi:hypothetical protein
MNDQPATEAHSSNTGLFVITEIVLLIVVALIAVSVGRRNAAAVQLFPIRPTATTSASAGQPLQIVTFEELNADPAAFLNHSIQVSGSFMPLPTPPCARYSGPDFRWALIADNLQLDALGFERLLGLLTQGTEMTVEGIWRLYEGPLGCGKGPARGTAWYLQVQRIVQPNPLVSTGGTGGLAIQNADPGLPSLLPTVPPTATPPATLEPTATVEELPTVPPVIGEATATATLAGSGTAMPVGSVTPAVATATTDPAFTPDSNTPTPSITPGGPTPPGGATATPATPLPATATQSSGGYPGPATSTPDPGPYP